MDLRCIMSRMLAKKQMEGPIGPGLPCMKVVGDMFV